MLVFEGFVGQRRSPARQQGLGEGARHAGQVQKGKEHLSPEVAILRLQRFLDLDHQLAVPGLGDADEAGAGGLIFGIGETGPEARAGFDADRMARRHELTHGFRGQGHAPFLILDFLG